MTAPPTAPAARRAGAASRGEGDWHAIAWRRVNQNVRRLQARIVQATQAGRWGKVKALQRLLTHSFSGKALAVRRVTENQGRRTPGVDRETWETPAKKATAIGALTRRGYRPRPLRRVYIPKSHGKRRPLGIPTCHPYCHSLQGKFGMWAGRGRHRRRRYYTAAAGRPLVGGDARRGLRCRTGLRSAAMRSGVRAIQRGWWAATWR